ncbi:porin [Castellaniella sp. MT123]|uniref:porin n=1 Tax=Castellaniella sp. MT123 TaxID=3140381 RepID=UPI0031F394ED
MKKTLLAAALLAGFATAGVAQAETSVTLYGILDTGYGFQNFKYNHNGADLRARSSGLRDGTLNGNRWGLKGSEDLGDGLRAIFQLEQGFNIGTGAASNSSNQFNRQSFVGLSSDNWGTFTMGRQYSAGIDTMAAEEGNNLGDFDKVFGAAGLSSGTRVNNSFKYTTPSFSGFKAVLLYGTGSTANSNSTTVISGSTAPQQSAGRGSRGSVGLGYTNGPLALGAAYDRQSVYGQDANARNVNAMTAWQINGAYDFEVVKFSAMFGQDRNGKIGWNGDANSYDGLAGLTGYGLGNGYQDFKSNNWALGLSAPVGPGRLFAFYSGSHSNLKDDDKWGSNAGNINAYQLKYEYPLSKRTKLYTYASYMQNVGYVKDLKGTEAGIGLNHKF